MKTPSAAAIPTTTKPTIKASLPARSRCPTMLTRCLWRESVQVDVSEPPNVEAGGPDHHDIEDVRGQGMCSSLAKQRAANRGNRAPRETGEDGEVQRRV